MRGPLSAHKERRKVLTYDASRCCEYRTLVATARLVAIGVLTAALAMSASETAIASGQSAARKSQRLSLSVPATGTSGERVLATGKVASAPRGARVVLQWLDGKKWMSLGHASVVHGRFKLSVTIPAGTSLLHVRAVLFKG